MASVLESFEFDKKHGNSKYDWDKWFDGRVWELSLKNDVASTPQSFKRMCYAASRLRGGTCRTRIFGDTIVIQFVPNK